MDALAANLLSAEDLWVCRFPVESSPPDAEPCRTLYRRSPEFKCAVVAFDL
jgi:hypothetical protein